MKYPLIIVLFLFLLGCSPDASYGSPKPETSIHEVGHGVYYFSCTGKTFAIELAKFAASHEVVALTGNGSNIGSYGYDIGYFVVCKEKQ